VSAQWTQSDPGAGSPADIRAEGSRRRTQSSQIQDAGANTAGARDSSSQALHGAAGSALVARIATYLDEMTIVASQAQTHGDVLHRYADAVDTIKQQQWSLEAGRASTEHELAGARRRLREQEYLTIAGGAEPWATYQQQANVDALSRRVAGYQTQLAELASQRQAADSRATSGLTGAEARGGLSGIVGESGPLLRLGVGDPLQRTVTLDLLSGLSEIDLATLFALHPELKQQLLEASDAESVATWWGGLGTEQRTALLLGASGLIGMLGGIPPLDRVAANRVNAVHLTAELEARHRELLDAVPTGGLGTDRVDPGIERGRIEAERDYLHQVMLGNVQLYAYDRDSNSIIEMVGVPSDETTMTLTYSGGTYTSVRGFYDGGVTSVSRWLNDRDPGIVGFVWKEGAFPGEEPDSGAQNIARILEANDVDTALAAGERIASFRETLLASDQHLAASAQVGMGHSWGLAAITSSEVAGAQYDQVHSLAGAGMPAEWDDRTGTRYHHWAYTDILTIGQTTGLIWDGRIPANDEAFSSTVYERDGDFDLYVGGGRALTLEGEAPSIPLSTTPVHNHVLIASDEQENQVVLNDVLWELRR
jgi:hypothetical protein